MGRKFQSEMMERILVMHGGGTLNCTLTDG